MRNSSKSGIRPPRSEFELHGCRCRPRALAYSSSRLSEELEEWERQRTGSSVMKRRKFRKELKSLEKRISEHDKTIEVCSVSILTFEI